jgi:hypothetical protein
MKITDIISRYRPNGEPAFGHIDMVYQNAVAADTITIGGFVFTYGTSFKGTSDLSLARNLTETINGDLASIQGNQIQRPLYPFHAYFIGNRVYIFSASPGDTSITLATSKATAFVISGATLTSGGGVAGGVTQPTTLDQYATVINSNTTTRPADTNVYASGDLVANSTTAGSVTPFSFTNAVRVAAGAGEIQAVRLYKSGTSLTNANFRVHFYIATVVPSNGDNGVWLTPMANYVGSFDVTCDKAFTDGAEGAGLPTVGMVRRFQLASGTTLYALLEARGTYTPTSGETFTIRAEISRY